jgi:hypothetical protein
MHLTVEAPGLTLCVEVLRQQLAQKDQQLAQKDEQLKEKGHQISDLHRIVENLTAKNPPSAFGQSVTPMTDAIQSTDITLRSMLAEDGAADEWIEVLERSIETDFPKACQFGHTAERWIENNRANISKTKARRIFQQLSRIEIVKFYRKIPGAQIAKAEFFLNEAKR